MSKTTYTVETLKVGDLEVDHRVQREGLKVKKVEEIYRNYNDDAVGVITVSRRTDRGLYIIDGWHRVEVIRRLTDNAGEIECHVFEGLTVAEEALMFLALNFSEKVTLLDKFKVRLTAGDPVALAIDEMVSYYGWKISSSPANAHVNAVGVLERLYNLSVKIEAEPNLVQGVFLVISRAWGIERYASQAVILEGLGRLMAEHGSKLEVDRLVESLASYKGGPQTLHAEAGRLAAIRKGKVSMAVAELITEEYNRGLKTDRRKLDPWRARS